MNTSNPKETPIQKMSRFYLDQVEQSAPALKNAVDDWQKFCHWCYCTASDTQSTILQRSGAPAPWLEQYQAMVQTAVESGLKAQAEWSKATIESAVELTRTLIKNLDQE